MGELQDTADRVVVLGRGRVLADASLPTWWRRPPRRGPAAYPGTRGRLRRPPRCRCRGDDRRPRAPSPCRVPAERIVAVLAAAGVAISAVSAQRAPLEDVYLTSRVPQPTSGRRPTGRSSDYRHHCPHPDLHRSGRRSPVCGADAGRGMAQVPHRPRLADRSRRRRRTDGRPSPSSSPTATTKAPAPAPASARPATRTSRPGPAAGRRRHLRIRRADPHW